MATFVELAANKKQTTQGRTFSSLAGRDAKEQSREVFKSAFPVKNMLTDIAVQNVMNPKPTLGAMAKEFIVPGRGYTDEQIATAKPTVKDYAVGGAKAVGEIGAGLYGLGTGALRLALGTETPEKEKQIRAKVDAALVPDTAGEAQAMRVADVFGIVAGWTKAGKLGSIKKAIVNVDNTSDARKILRSNELTDDIISKYKLDEAAVGVKNTKDADAFVKAVDTVVKNTATTAKGIAPVAGKVTTPETPTVKLPTTAVPTVPVVSKLDVPDVPTPTTPVRTVANTVPDTTVPRSPTTTLDPRNFKTADEFVQSGKFSVKADGRNTVDNVEVKKLIESKQDEFTKANIDNPKFTKTAETVVKTGNKEEIEKLFRVYSNKPEYILRQVGRDLPSGFNKGINNPKYEIVKQYKATDPVAFSSARENYVTSQLTDIWNQAQKTAPAPERTIPPVNKEATKVAEQRMAEVEEVKKWQDAPAETQKVATQEVAKTYSGTDAAKGFVSDAVNHIDNIPPIKNVTAKARNHAQKPNTPIDLPPETLRGWLQTRIQDSAYRLGLVQKNIIKSGKTISDDANAYLQREAYIGRAAAKVGAFEKKMGMVAGNKTGLLVRMKKDGIDLTQLDEYMRAKAAKARNERVSSKTGGKIADGGSGLTNKQADEILAQYKDDTKIDNYAKELRDTAINAKMQVLKDAGIYTDEQIKLITQGEPDYVPFKVEEFSRVQGGGKGFSVQSTGVKGIKGSARTDRTNAVIQTVVDYEEAVIRAEKNKSLQSLAKLIDENPDSTLWEVKSVTYTPQYNKYGEVQFLRKNPINERTSVEFFKDGKAYEILFHDEALAKVFTEQGLTKPIPGLVKINNYLRAVNTVINPEFMITNAIRDLQTAIVTAGGEKGAVVAAKMVKDYPAASKGIWQAVRKESNTGWAKVYNEMVENGGKTGWFDMKDVGDTTKEVSARIARYNSDKTSDSLMRAIDSTGKLISDANEVMEMSIRTTAYKQLVDGGMSKVAAANYAKNMTVNFNKRGNWGMTLNSAYLFANAGIQGSARLLMAMKNPKVRRITYGIAASSYALNELNMKINPEGYERIQDFQKERNLIVMLPLDGNKYNIPGISGDPANGYYLKMPLPYGFNIFKVAGDVAHDVVNKKKTGAEAMVQMLRAIDASFNPLSSGTPTQFISPTFADPFVSHFENKNWFGAPIMPEQPAFAPAVRDSDRYFSGARDLSVETAQFLNRLTGGNEVTAGAVDISPETIDHIIDSLGGGLGNFIGQTIDGTISSIKGDVPTPDNMPFVRKMIDTPFKTGEQSQVFELLERSSSHRMSQIEIDRFADSTIKAMESGQIDTKTGKRVIKEFVANAARQEAGEVLSLINEGKTEEAMALMKNAPPGIAKELNKLVKDDLEKEIERLQKEQAQ